MAILRKILLVEDSKFDVQLVKLAMEDSNIQNELMCLKNGSELLEYLQAYGYSEIAFIMMDLNMPKLSGIDVLQRLQEMGHKINIPIIIFSSSQQPSDVETCYRLGANAYVVKPVDGIEFANTVQTLAQFWANVNIIPPNS